MLGIFLEYSSMPKAIFSLVSMHVSIAQIVNLGILKLS
jgi:hypothetical protein